MIRNIINLVAYIYNPFLSYKVCVSILNILVLLYYTKFGEYDDIKSIGIFTYYAMLLTFGFPIHLKRNPFVLHNFRFIFFTIIIIYNAIIYYSNSILTIIFSNYNVNYLLLHFSVINAISYLILDKSVKLKEPLKFLLVDLLLLTISYVSIIYKNHIILLILLNVRIINLYKYNISDYIQENNMSISKIEIFTSFMSIIVSTYPMILVTTFYLGYYEKNVIEIYLIKLTSIISIFLISSINKLINKKYLETLNYNKISSWNIYIFTSIFLILTFLYLYTEKEMFLVSLLPVISLSGVWNKQIISYLHGTKIILIYNLLFGATIYIGHYFNNIFIIFTIFYFFNTIVVNLYAKTKLL